jgi:murein tripeptide amidase MpaA
MQIATDFEGGRIELKASTAASSEKGSSVVVLSVLPDAGAPKFRQWFAFEARGEPGVLQEFQIENAGDCTWGDAFGGLYKVYASYDEEAWFRVDTTLTDKRLAFSHRPLVNRVRYAYSPPFSSARLARLLVEVRALKGAGGPPRANCQPLVATARGTQLHHIEIGSDATDAKELWVIAQQHPGEPMAGWFVEGLVERIVSGDARASELLARARIHVVPRMNPDGCALANHRTNEAGLDLNREWGNPETKSVEVRAVREAMKKSGAHFFLDVHGDERLPYVFVQPADRFTGRAARFLDLENAFERSMSTHDSNFQTTHRYPIIQRDKPNVAIASSWAQSVHGCLALTLEMPFSDNKNAPDPAGWSPERSKRLGSATIDTLADIVGDL